jgi:hypothetical protein
MVSISIFKRRIREIPTDVRPVRLPIELIEIVARQACQDDYDAAYLLRSCSHAFRDMIEPFRFHRVLVHGCINMERLAALLEPLPEERRPKSLLLYHGPAPGLWSEDPLRELILKTRDILISAEIITPSRVLNAIRTLCSQSAPSLRDVRLMLTMHKSLPGPWLPPNQVFPRLKNILIGNWRNWSVIPTQIMHCTPALDQIHVFFLIQLKFRGVAKLLTSDYFDIRLTHLPTIHVYGFPDVFLVDFIIKYLSCHEVVGVPVHSYQQSVIIHPYSLSSKDLSDEDRERIKQGQLARVAATSDYPRTPVQFRGMRKVTFAFQADDVINSHYWDVSGAV